MPTRTVPARGGALPAAGPKQSRRGSRNATVEEETRSEPEVEAPEELTLLGVQDALFEAIEFVELASWQRAAFG